MHHIRRILLFIGLLLMAAALAIILKQTLQKEQLAETPSIRPSILALSSPAFQNNGAIALNYTCKGEGLIPPLLISSQVEGAKSYALLMHDTESANGDAVHWLLWNIPAGTTMIDSTALPAGTVQGITSFGSATYTSPCPAAGSGKHRYVFEIYALGKQLDLPAGSNRDALMLAMNGNLLEQADLTGIFEIE